MFQELNPTVCPLTDVSNIKSNCLPKACANGTPRLEDLAAIEHGCSIGLLLQLRSCHLSELGSSSTGNSETVWTDGALATSRFKGGHLGSWKLRMSKVFPSLTVAKGGKTLSYILRKMAFPALTSRTRPHENLNQRELLEKKLYRPLLPFFSPLVPA